MVQRTITELELITGKQNTYAPSTVRALPDPMIEDTKEPTILFVRVCR
jgi:hypothetical protein